MRRRRVAVLISGRGSNMAALVEASGSSDFPAEIRLVLANRPEAGGLMRAAAAGIETCVVDHRDYPDRESFEQTLAKVLRAKDIELVCLAGFMRVLTFTFVEGWAGRMINIHPSLLPLFRGTHTHRRALDAGVLVHGCTVHFVVPEIDAGPILAQAAVAVLPGDTEESLAARVLAQELVVYPQALRMVSSGDARLEDGRVIFREAWSGAGALRSPG